LRIAKAQLATKPSQHCEPGEGQSIFCLSKLICISFPVCHFAGRIIDNLLLFGGGGGGNPNSGLELSEVS